MKRSPLLRVVVVGAGVVGTLILQRLRDLSDDVEIICIEKGAKSYEAGTGLNIAPNAIKTLSKFLPALAAALQQPDVSLPWLSWTAGLTDGTVIMDLPLSQVASHPGIRIRWSMLYRQLRTGLDPWIRYNTIATEMGYDFAHPNRPLYLVTQNQLTGESERFDQIDLILACDGRYSQVRQTFFGGTPQPDHLGVCIYRVLVPNRADQLIGDYQQWFHAGTRLLTFAIPGQAVYIAGSLPLGSDQVIPDEAKTARFLQQRYQSPRGYSEVCQFLVDSICDNLDQVHWARVQEIPTVFNDAGGHVLCLGDSAHAMFPTLAQGATQAFEDGCLAGDRLLHAVIEAQERQTALNIPQLTAQIAHERQARIEFVKQFSREASDSLLAGSEPIAELKAKTQPAFLRQLTQLYQDVPAPLPEVL
ncbi:FAD-dependent monooxygenase [Phormidium tenue FACHB-886]|nr:FAD-dependent monooxygenase [Phormidium tenue FACHB-886]